MIITFAEISQDIISVEEVSLSNFFMTEKSCQTMTLESAAIVLNLCMEINKDRTIHRSCS